MVALVPRKEPVPQLLRGHLLVDPSASPRRIARLARRHLLESSMHSPPEFFFSAMLSPKARQEVTHLPEVAVVGDVFRGVASEQPNCDLARAVRPISCREALDDAWRVGLIPTRVREEETDRSRLPMAAFRRRTVASTFRLWLLARRVPRRSTAATARLCAHPAKHARAEPAARAKLLKRLVQAPWRFPKLGSAVVAHAAPAARARS